MSYKYINPGYYTLFSGWTGDTQKQTANDFEKNPLNGLVISNRSLYYTIPAESTAVYCSFGLYPVAAFYGDHQAVFSISSSTMLKNELQFNFNYNAAYTDVTVGAEKFRFFHKIERRKYNRILFKVDTTAGSVDVWINGEQLYSQVDKEIIRAFDNLQGRIIRISGAAEDYLSNFIISDEEILPNEDVLVLPQGEVEASVEPNEDGSYTFTQEGQQFLMETEVEPLSVNDIITGIAAIAYPGYATGDGLYHVKSIAKDASGNITEHSADAVPSDTMAATAASYATRLTKAELDAQKIGLRVTT